MPYYIMHLLTLEKPLLIATAESLFEYNPWRPWPSLGIILCIESEAIKLFIS